MEISKSEQAIRLFIVGNLGIRIHTQMILSETSNNKKVCDGKFSNSVSSMHNTLQQQKIFPCLSLSLFHSEITSTDLATRSSAWLGWLKTSSLRSPTRWCPSWKAEGLNHDRPSPPPPYRRYTSICDCQTAPAAHLSLSTLTPSLCFLPHVLICAHLLYNSLSLKRSRRSDR